ncbi:hypothetical protein FF1_017089 [Malus domestica]
MAANKGRDAVVEAEKEKLRNKIRKTEATIADQQKRIGYLKSAGRELLILFVALYGRFLWIINGGQGLRCSDYWFFLGYHMFLCAVGWSLAVNGVYYILSIKESDRTLNECRELKKTLAVLDGSNIPKFDGEPSQNAFGVWKIISAIVLNSLVSDMLISCFLLFSATFTNLCREGGAE